jgi:nitrate reductase NapAB chaperone NapD
MVKMGEIEKLIKNTVFRIHDNITELLPSTNGVVNENMMKNGLLSSLYRAARSLEPFVKVNMNYPQQEHTEVQFETDLIVMRTKDYEDILNHIKKLENNIIPKEAYKNG